MRDGRNWQAVPAAGGMIGENDQGKLIVRAQDGSFLQVYFEGPVVPRFWSLSEDGQKLLYVLRAPAIAPEIRLHHFGTGQDFVVVDSLRFVRGIRMFPDASGFIVWQSMLQADSVTQRLYCFNLPERTLYKTFSMSRRDALFSPAKNSRRLAYVREHASINGVDSLMILDLQTEELVKIPLQDRTVSDLVWTEGNRHIVAWEWQTGYSAQEGERMNLRVYSTSTLASRLIVQRPTFGHYYSPELFASGDDIFYLMPAPPRICVFEQNAYSYEELLQLPTTQHKIDALAWAMQGDRLFVHALGEDGNSDFYLIGSSQIEHFRKPFAVSSVSLLPDGRHFAGVKDQRLLLDAVASPAPNPLMPNFPCTAAALHPAGTHLAVFGMPRVEARGVPAQPLLLIDLKQNVAVDSLLLPYSDQIELQWLHADKDQKNFSAIWRRGTRGYTTCEYYHVTFGVPLVTLIYHDYWSSDFALYPPNSYLTLLRGDQILLTQWRIDVP